MSTSDSTHTDTTPTAALVHGAFVDASHAVPASQPADVAKVIVRAVRSIT